MQDVAKNREDCDLEDLPEAEQDSLRKKAADFITRMIRSNRRAALLEKYTINSKEIKE